MTERDRWVADLEALADEGRALRERSRLVAEQFAALIPAPAVDVVVELDDEGIITAVTIGDEARDVDHDALVGAINIAVSTASSARRARLLEARGAAFPVELPPAFDLSMFIGSLARGEALEPQRISNDLSTVTALVFMGEVGAVELDENWVSQTPLGRVGDEIARVARIAAERNRGHTNASDAGEGH
ncbi:hypothetical protein MN032_03510 [Agromyces atrinae]|uniref:hypothetical protein n=1 Tax=Agromyces atrinae TaxID=592376 RepID=UPI001F56B64D|nr:hypothetical protein [Agromyces atrinae]MCI2956751.1 hypothetical protein [Agromyces atrinae]